MTQSFIHWLNSNWNGKNFAWNINKFRNIISEIELKELEGSLVNWNGKTNRKGWGWSHYIKPINLNTICITRWTSLWSGFSRIFNQDISWRQSFTKPSFTDNIVNLSLTYLSGLPFSVDRILYTGTLSFMEDRPYFFIISWAAVTGRNVFCHIIVLP